MSNKHKFDRPRQERRQRALERFKMKPIVSVTESGKASYDAYIERKHQEMAALNSALQVRRGLSF